MWRQSGAVSLPDTSISTVLSLKHIPVIIGMFVLAIHWIGEGYQVSVVSVVWTKPQGKLSLKKYKSYRVRITDTWL